MSPALASPAVPQNLYDLLNEIFLILDDGNRRFFGNYSLTTARFYTLLHLGESPGLSFGELSDLMLCDKSNTTRIIKGMENDGLVLRQPHETDGRSARLYLSPAGEALRLEAVKAHLGYNATRFGQLAEGEQRQLLAGLKQLKRSLRRHLDNHRQLDEPVVIEYEAVNGR